MTQLCTPKCYVCGNPAGWSDSTGRTSYLCSECVAARIHTILMTIDHVSGTETYSVATCPCGWHSRIRRDGEAWWVPQHDAVRAHWVGVIRAAAGVAA